GGLRRARPPGRPPRRVLHDGPDRAHEGGVMNRIALFLPNWIGDVVMATPAVRAVRAAFPAAELVAVCKPYVADVLAGAPGFARTIFADKRRPRPQRLLAVVRELRPWKVDAAV